MTEAISSKSFHVVCHEDTTVRLEYNKDYAILHLFEIRKFNKGTLHWLLSYTEDLWTFLSTVGYTNMYIAVQSTDEKINKLGRRLGFSPIGEADGLTVYSYKETK